MSSMADTQSQRGNNYNRSGQALGQRGSGYGQPLTRNTNTNYHSGYGNQQGHTAANMAALTHGLQGMNLHDATYSNQSKAAVMAAAGHQFNGLPIPAALWGATNHLMFPGGHSYPAAVHQHNPGLYTPVAAQYIPHGYHQQQHDNSPMSQAWTPSHTTGEVPTLITPRRDSISSNENDAPGTPSYAGYPTYHQVPGVAIVNRSPTGMYTQSSPSPTQVLAPYGMPLSKMAEHRSISPSLHMLVNKEPAIPQAIPAPSSPLKPLDRALENIRGETNVYIRGLHPETTDEMLEGWGKRFGDIRSSKSIIDHSTGLCKGFGFVKYHNYEDAENCIRGFHYLGYEVSFARESFYSKLKTFADEGNTNLYVSNLPKSLNEHELASVFTPHKVCSARILRDKNGTCRGVGFARFESRTVCEEVIKKFNNYKVNVAGEEYTIQIRFADTQEQKQLKQQTAAARQFRSAEYEYATQAHKAGYSSSRGSYASNNEFETYMTTSVPIQNQRWSQSALRNMSGRAPLAALPYGNNVQYPVAQTNGGAKSENQPPARTDLADTKSATNSSPAIARGDQTAVESTSSDDQIS
ncbi:RNA-binding domain-containing protein, partial [Aureobasidium melanogenum]